MRYLGLVSRFINLILCLIFPAIAFADFDTPCGFSGAGFRPAFTVSRVPTMVFSVTADGLLTKNASNLVSSWDSQGATGSFAQSTDANKPTYIEDCLNHKACLRFDGGDTLAGDTNAKTLLKNLGGYTVFTLASVDAAASGGVRYAWNWSVGTSTNGRAVLLQNNATGTYGMRRLDADGSATLSPANFWSVAATPYLATVWMDHTNNDGELFRDGVSKSSNTALGTTGSTSNTNSQSAGIGDNNAANFWDGDIAGIWVFNSALSAANRKLVEKTIGANYGLAVDSLVRHTVVFDGDSITSGSGLSASQIVNTKFRVLRGNPGDINTANDGTSGHTCAAMDTQAATTIDAMTFATQDIPVLMVLCGTNDAIAATAASTIWSNIQTYRTNRVAAGWTEPILIGTVPATDGTAPQTILDSLNALIRANWQSAGFNGIIDYAALPQFDQETDTDNTTYYQGDKIHPTAAGMALLGGVANDAFTTYVNNP